MSLNNDLKKQNSATFLMHVSSLKGEIFRGLSWKVKEESLSIVIKTEMNDGAVVLTDLMTGEVRAPSNFKSVLGYETVIAMPACPSFHT